jgi:hypothetical protein
MKKLVISIVICSAVIVLIYFVFASKGHNIELKLSNHVAPAAANKMSTSFAEPYRQKVATYLHELRIDCAKNRGCGIDDTFCAKPGCIDTIVKCHLINDSIFNILTNNGAEASAPFEPGQIKTILDNTDCSTQKIECYRHRSFLGLGPYYYRIRPVPIDDSEYETYYSRPLLQYIYDKGIDSFTLYNATPTSDGHNVIPIRVKYTGSVDANYYDLSNDFP